jgi:hypothetical protein
MKLTDLQLKSAEMLAKMLSFGRFPNSPEDLDSSLSEESINKAVDVFQKRKFTKPLTLALIMEGFQHNSFKLLNYRTDANPYKEVEYTIDYIKKRVKWLESKYPTQLYRVKTFIELLQNNNWNLESPFKVHLSDGKVITVDLSVEESN